tara:strand:- start:38 stop:343 length:306 start_codon:yes stop_codon:yes gene_type:complete
MADEAPKVDLNNPIHVSGVAGIKRAIKTGDYTNVANIQQAMSAVDFSNEVTKGDEVVGKEELYVLTDASGVDHEVGDPGAMKVLLGQGMTLKQVKTVDIMG